MQTLSVNIQALDIRYASDHEYVALNQFDNIMRAERTPDEPQHTLAYDIRQWQHIPSFIQLHNWAAWSDDGAQIIASGGGGFADFPENRHLMFCSVEVLPAHRRHGLARELLARVAAASQQAGRRMLVGESYLTVPAGQAFAEHIGAKMVLAERLSQLELSKLNRALIQQWIADTHSAAHDFELDFWIGAYPDEDLPAICELLDVMNTAPRGELDMEDWHQTPERVRESERATLARGYERWTAYVRHNPSGQLAGFTSTGWTAEQPELLEQYGTGVMPQYRHHGLGRWLKAAMLDKILRERSQVQTVRTINANANAPMLKINDELGFKYYYTQYDWQVDLDTVNAYLARSGDNR